MKLGEKEKASIFALFEKLRVGDIPANYHKYAPDFHDDLIAYINETVILCDELVKHIEAERYFMNEMICVIGADEVNYEEIILLSEHNNIYDTHNKIVTCGMSLYKKFFENYSDYQYPLFRIAIEKFQSALFFRDFSKTFDCLTKYTRELLGNNYEGNMSNLKEIDNSLYELRELIKDYAHGVIEMGLFYTMCLRRAHKVRGIMIPVSIILTLTVVMEAAICAVINVV